MFTPTFLMLILSPVFFCTLQFLSFYSYHLLSETQFFLINVSYFQLFIKHLQLLRNKKLLSSNRWQLSFRFIFLFKQSFFWFLISSHVQQAPSLPLVSFHPIQLHALLLDIDSLFRLSLAPSLTSGSRRITLLLFLLQIPFSSVIYIHALIKREWLNRFKIRDYQQAYRLIFEYIEAFYNTKRIHSHCDYMSPNDFEKLYEQTQTNELLLVS